MKNRMDLVDQAYSQSRTRTLHGWVYDEQLSDGRVVVYVDQETGKVHVGVRGTQTENIDDIKADLSIMVSGNAGDLGLLDKLEEIEEKYPYAKKTLSSHSLGGTQVANLMLHHEDIFDDYEEIDLANPGASAFLDDESVQAALDSDKTNLMLNPGDIISSQYISQMGENRNNVYYGKSSADALEVHSLDQWRNDDNMIVV